MRAGQHGCVYVRAACCLYYRQLQYFQEGIFMKKTLALLLAALAILLCFAACGKKNDTPSVYYLNFKPEQDTQWKALAKTYTEKTGVPVTVVTAV